MLYLHIGFIYFAKSRGALFKFLFKCAGRNCLRREWGSFSCKSEDFPLLGWWTWCQLDWRRHMDNSAWSFTGVWRRVLVLQTANLGLVVVCSPKRDEFEMWCLRSIDNREFNSLRTLATRHAPTILALNVFQQVPRLSESCSYELIRVKTDVKGAYHVMPAHPQSHEMQDVGTFEASMVLLLFVIVI